MPVDQRLVLWCNEEVYEKITNHKRVMSAIFGAIIAPAKRNKAKKKSRAVAKNASKTD